MVLAIRPYKKNYLHVAIVICFVPCSKAEYCDLHGGSSNSISGSSVSNDNGNQHHIPDECQDFPKADDYDQLFSPLIECSNLPQEFIECSQPLDHKGNETAKNVVGYGCTKVIHKI